MYRFGDHEFEQVPGSLKLVKIKLDVLFRWRWGFSSNHVSPLCDWLDDRLVVANRPDRCRDLASHAFDLLRPRNRNSLLVGSGPNRLKISLRLHPDD